MRQMIVGVACANGVSAIDMVSTNFTGINIVSVCVSCIVGVLCLECLFLPVRVCV